MTSEFGSFREQAKSQSVSAALSLPAGRAKASCSVSGIRTNELRKLPNLRSID